MTPSLVVLLYTGEDGKCIESRLYLTSSTDLKGGTIMFFFLCIFAYSKQNSLVFYLLVLRYGIISVSLCFLSCAISLLCYFLIYFLSLTIFFTEFMPIVANILFFFNVLLLKSAAIHSVVIAIVFVCFL